MKITKRLLPQFSIIADVSRMRSRSVRLAESYLLIDGVAFHNGSMVRLMVEKLRRMDQDARIRERVGQIADALNVPTEYFYADTAIESGVAEANECLRLWFRIETTEGRRRALEILRLLAEGGEP